MNPLAAALLFLAQTTQNPSPMQEHTRPHPLTRQQQVPGQREKLSLGTLFLPDGWKRSGPVPLVVHFHGGTWLPEWASVQTGHRFAVLSVQLGEGSSVYSKPFSDPQRYSKLLAEVSERIGAPVGKVTLSGFSAGYGAVREILRTETNWDHVDTVVLADGMHAGYQGGVVIPADVEPFVAFAREAVAGRKRMLVTHSEIYPGTFASTTETADFLLDALQLKRQPVLRRGPIGMQQLSVARSGQFLLMGFAGNSAPDHIDHLQALPHWWNLARAGR